MVMAYHNQREFEAFQFILEHWSDLVEMRSPFKFLFVKSYHRDIQTGHEHSVLEYQDPPEMTKRCQLINRQWSVVARHIWQSVECKCWFWWEHDVLPVRKDCFEFFMQKWTNKCQIMGYRVKDKLFGMHKRINGVAFYARDYWRFMEPYFNLDTFFDRLRPFGRKDRRLFVELNKWYFLAHHEGPVVLTPRMRLVHGVKDHSLRDQIVNGTRNYPVHSDLRRTIRGRLKVVYVNTGLRGLIKRCER